MPDSLLVDVAKRNTGESLKAGGDRDRLFPPSVVLVIHGPLAGDHLHPVVWPFLFQVEPETGSLVPGFFQPRSSLDILLPPSQSCSRH